MSLRPKILVTGGCGYIGSHTVVDLLQHDFDVVSIDSNIRSKALTVDRIESITGKRIKNYPVDLCNAEATRKVLEAEAKLMASDTSQHLNRYPKV